MICLTWWQAWQGDEQSQVGDIAGLSTSNPSAHGIFQVIP